MACGDIVAPNAPYENQMKTAYALGQVLLNEGDSLSVVTSAFLEAKFRLQDTAAVLNVLKVGLADAYTLLLNAGTGQEICDVARGMITAKYDTEGVLIKAVADLETQGQSLNEIFVALIGEIDNGQGETELQVDIAVGLTKVYKDKGVSLVEICSGLFNAQVSLSTIAEGLQKSSVSLDAAKTLLTDLGAGQELIAVTFALINGGYDAEEVFAAVVGELLTQGQTVSGILNTFVGTVADGQSPAGKQMNYAAFIIKVIPSVNDELGDIVAWLSGSGFGESDIMVVLNNAGMEADNVFNALIGFRRRRQGSPIGCRYGFHGVRVNRYLCRISYAFAGSRQCPDGDCDSGYRIH
jgi:hypothetical protein